MVVFRYIHLKFKSWYSVMNPSVKSYKIELLFPPGAEIKKKE